MYLPQVDSHVGNRSGATRTEKPLTPGPFTRVVKPQRVADSARGLPGRRQQSNGYLDERAGRGTCDGSRRPQGTRHPAQARISLRQEKEAAAVPLQQGDEAAAHLPADG